MHASKLAYLILGAHFKQISNFELFETLSESVKLFWGIKSGHPSVHIGMVLVHVC